MYIYIKKFLAQIKIGKPTIIEVHNRPSYLIDLHKKFNHINYVLIIHNDPLNLEGSFTIKQRVKLLEICKQIYFVSSWVEDKFFENIEKNYYSNFKTIYPSIKKNYFFSKKRKFNCFFR